MKRLILCYAAGVALLVGVSMTTLVLAGVLVTVMGIFAGSSYVLGFTLLQENVDDELRGRVFAGVYILVRMCVLLSMAHSFLSGSSIHFLAWLAARSVQSPMLGRMLIRRMRVWLWLSTTRLSI